MEGVLGYGDDSEWEGLACPPLDEFSFDFTGYNLDGILDDPLLESDEEEDVNEVAGVGKKANVCYGNFGRGKELKLNLDMAEIKAFLEEKTEEVAEQKVKMRRIMDCYGCQSMQLKERSRLKYAVRRLAVVGGKRKADCIVRLEAAGHKIHGSHESTRPRPPMQPKYIERPDHANKVGVLGNKRKADADLGLEDSRHKLHHSSQSARQDLMNYSNQLEDNKMHTDYDSRYEATRRMLHVSYKRVEEAKKQRKIQVIDFQKAVMEQQRGKAKTKGKSCLQQRLMAMGTHKSNKKFQPFVY